MSPAGSRGLNPVRPHRLVLRAENHPLQIDLGDDQAIERIALMRRQAAGMLGIGACHWQEARTRAPAL